MTKKVPVKPIAAAVGVSFVAALAVSTPAMASDNPFAAADLDSSHLLLAGGDKDDEEGKCGEGKCKAEGNCSDEDEADCSGDEGDCSDEGEGEGDCSGEGDDG